MTDIKDILADRGKTHGNLEDQACLSQELMSTIRKSPNWVLLSSIQRQSLEMNMLKVSRILCGDPNEPDHWMDSSGYMKLAADRCSK